MSLNKPRYERLNVIIIISFVSLFVCNLNALAQDLHFSQLHVVPLHTNPANTGTSEADFRFMNLYRNQWRKIDVPFNTLQFTADKKIKMFGRQFGLGGLVLYDESSSLYLNALNLYISLSHAFYYRKNRFTVALQPGFVNKQFDNRRITFASQFNEGSEEFDPSFPSNEDFLNNKLSYFDLNAGVLWQSRIKTWKPALGFAINHINRPVESFYSGNDSSRVALKYTFHGQMYIPIKSKFSFEPQFIYTTSNGATDFVFGAMSAFYPLKDNIAVRKLYAISNFRVNPVQTVDALIIGVGMQYMNFDVCISYDFNVSSLREATRYSGGFEISLVYIYQPGLNKSDLAPCFML